jgi:hypothetical protein
MGGGGGSPSSRPAAQAAPLPPVPTAGIQAAQGPNYGPTMTPNPYMANSVPPWAQGWFQMPWWGMDPFGNPMGQEQMQYQQPAPPPMQQAAPEQQSFSGNESFNKGYSPLGDVRYYNMLNDPYERYLYEQGQQAFNNQTPQIPNYLRYGLGGSRV